MKTPAGYEKQALKALYNLSQATMRAKNVEEVFESILDKAMKIIGVEKASIMRYYPADSSLKIIAAKGIPQKIVETVSVKAGEGISGKVFLTEKPVLVKDVGKEKRALKQKRYKSRSLISAPVTCFPLKVSGKSVGVINMTDKKSGEPFTNADLEILTTIAAQAAAYIHIYDLMDNVKESERMRQEIEMAREIQAALLPEKVPPLKGLKVAGHCVMASRIGGDYYDFLNSGWAPPAFVVADVSGHDVGAALLMSAFRSALRAEAGVPVLPPSAILRRLNRVMYNDLVKAEQFISVFYIQYIHSSKTLRYASAGHHPVWVYNKKSKKFKKLITDGPLLGIERGEHFFEKKCVVSKDDIAVMYTDGLIEIARKDGKRFGMNRLKKAIAKYSNKSPKLMINGISKEVSAFVGSEPVKDDITLVVLKFG